MATQRDWLIFYFDRSRRAHQSSKGWMVGSRDESKTVPNLIQQHDSSQKSKVDLGTASGAELNEQHTHFHTILHIYCTACVFGYQIHSLGEVLITKTVSQSGIEVQQAEMCIPVVPRGKGHGKRLDGQRLRQDTFL